MFKPNYAAEILFRKVCDQGRRGLLWSKLTGRSRYLYNLAQVTATCRIIARHNSGLQIVPISQIRGSRGRSKDFDHSFNLLRSHNRERWLRIAEARQQAIPLPLINLIQIGDKYFVSDGHHRISVAQAFGQKEMEAQVTVWQVDGTLPWENSTSTPNSTLLDLTIKQIWTGGRKLNNRIMLSLGAILIDLGMKLKARFEMETVSGNVQ